MQIGRDNISGGIKYCDLYNQLKKEGYEINSCVNRTLREWFYTSFFHEEAHCDIESGIAPYTNVKNLDDHKCCSFILKGDSCLKLLQYEEFEKTNEILQSNQSQINLLQSQLNLTETSSIEANKTARKSLNFAIGAIIITAILSAPNWFGGSNNDIKSTIVTTKSEIIAALKKEQSSISLTNQYLDSLNLTLKNLAKADTLDNIYLEKISSISLTLQKINKNLK